MEDRDAFLHFLDSSLQVLRKHLASAYDAKHDANRLLNLESELQAVSLPSRAPQRPRSHSKDAKGPEVAPVQSPRSESPAQSEAPSVRFGEQTRIEIEKGETPVFPEASLTELSDFDIGEEDKEDAISHGDSSALLQSDLRDLSQSEQQMIRHRLRVRLGVITKNRLVSGKSLHDSLSALGLTRYTEQEINDLVNHLATFVDLSFEEEEELTWSAGTIQSTIQSTLDPFDLFGLRGFDPAAAKPVWQWPSGTQASLRNQKSTISFHREKSTFSIYKDPSNPDIHVDTSNLVNFNVVPLEALMDVFLAHEGPMQLDKSFSFFLGGGGGGA